MKKLILFLFSAFILSGCAGLDKIIDGDEPTYDENGKRNNGLSPNITGYFKEQVMLEVLKRMKEGDSGGASFLNITEYHPGWLNGVIENRSAENKLFNVKIYDSEKKDFYFGPVVVAAKSFKQIWLPRGLGYYANADEGEFKHSFDVLDNRKTDYPLVQGGSISCYFFIYKEW